MNQFFENISANAILTVTITLLAFFLGFVIQQYIEKRKERKRLNKLEQYFYTGIDFIEHALKEQVDFYKELADNIKDINQHKYTYLERTRLYLDNIKFISDLDLYEIFINRKSMKQYPEKIQHFHNLNNATLYIPHQNRSSKESFEDFQTRVRKLDMRWADDSNLLINAIERTLKTNIKDNVALNIQNEIKHIYSTNDSNSSMTHMKVFYETYVIKLKAICIAHAKTDFFYQLMPLLRRLSTTYHSIYTLRHFYSDKFLKDSEKLSQKLRILKESIQYFKPV